MRVPLGEVRVRLVNRGLTVKDPSLAAALSALAIGKHIALIPKSLSNEEVTAVAELLADCAATLNLCVGWLNFHFTAGGLIKLDDLLRPRFVADLWLVLIEPSPLAISRIVDDVLRLWGGSDARLIVATSEDALRQARLSTAGRRMLIPIAL
jgi:hypothetical protein